MPPTRQDLTQNLLSNDYGTTDFHNDTYRYSVTPTQDEYFELSCNRYKVLDIIGAFEASFDFVAPYAVPESEWGGDMYLWHANASPTHVIPCDSLVEGSPGIFVELALPPYEYGLPGLIFIEGAESPDLDDFDFLECIESGSHYYCDLSRVDTTLLLSIYSDAAKTALVDAVACECPSAALTCLYVYGDLTGLYGFSQTSPLDAGNYTLDGFYTEGGGPTPSTGLIPLQLFCNDRN